jgi:glucose-6-phosphate 1-dehydrogenase
MRDMVPNHLFQLITLTAMEPPMSFEADAVRDEQAKMLHAIQPFSNRRTCSAARCAGSTETARWTGAHRRAATA